MSETTNITPEMQELMAQLLAAQQEAPKARKQQRTIKNPSEPASYKQKAFVGNLLLDAMFPNGVSKGQASEMIEGLKAKDTQLLNQLSTLLA